MELAPLDEKDPAEAVRDLEAELAHYDEALADKPRWLVFTKADLLTEDEADARVQAVLEALDWSGEWAVISAVANRGTDELVQRIARALERREDERRTADPEENPFGEPLPETPPEPD